MSHDPENPVPSNGSGKHLYRIAGTSRATGRFLRAVALVRAPTPEAALRIAIALHAGNFVDLRISGELADLP